MRYPRDSYLRFPLKITDLLNDTAGDIVCTVTRRGRAPIHVRDEGEERARRVQARNASPKQSF